MVRAKALLSDGFQVLIIRGLNVASAAAVSILVSRALGPAGRGSYVLPGIIAALIATMFAGLSTTIASWMLREKSGSGALRAGVLAAVPLVALGVGAAYGLALWLHAPWAAPYAIAVLPFMALGAIVNGYAYGIGNVRAVTGFTLATSVATLAFLGAGFLMGGRSATVAITMWLVANILIALFGIGIVVWHSRRLTWERVATWPFLTYAMRVGATALVSMLNYRIDLYIVAFFRSHAELGLYTTAVSAAEVLLVVAQVASIVTVPHIGSLSRTEAAHFTARCVRNNLVFITLSAAGAAVVAPYVIELLFGPAFMPAVAPFRILLLGIVPMSSASIISSYYTLNAKQPQIPLIIAGISTVVCAIVSTVLVPHYGIIGAAIGSTVSYSATVAIGLVLFSAHAKVGISRIIFVQGEDYRGYRALLASLLQRAHVSSA